MTRSFLTILLCSFGFFSFAQVDTLSIYNQNTPFGLLDIRIAKSASRYYNLEESKTYTFRRELGASTNDYLDCTEWNSVPYSQGNLRELNNGNSNFVMNYRLLKPEAYPRDDTTTYPLLVVLHDGANRGNCFGSDCYWSDRNWRPVANIPNAPSDSLSRLLNNDDQLQIDGRLFLGLTEGADTTIIMRPYPGFILFPQSLNTWNAEPLQDVIRIVRLLSKKYRIDQNRILVQGFGEGGSAVYEITKRAPWLFAGAAAISAIHDSGVSSGAVMPLVSSVSFKMYQGSEDTNPQPGKTEGYVYAFATAGLSADYKKFPGYGHEIRDLVIEDADFRAWLSSASKTEIQVKYDKRVLCDTIGDNTTLILASGFHEYQWERNGFLLEGASSAQLVANLPGVYRARFARKFLPGNVAWTNWSKPVEITTATPLKPMLRMNGTPLLPDLNGLSSVTLSAEVANVRYRWMKNKTILDLPGNRDDTTRNLIAKPAMGSGNFSLLTIDDSGCPSDTSASVWISFNNQAPVSLATPQRFKSVSKSHNTITLSWADMSAEKGFEISRRELNMSGALTPWKLIRLTAENINSITDTLLMPSTEYHYKLRAVGINARSYYLPSYGYQLVVTTSPPPVPNIPFQVDTSFVYNTATPFGLLDIRIAKASNRYYYLKTNQTVSYRETSPGVRTNTFFDMTSWDSSPYSEGNLREIDGSADNFVMNYRLLFPVSYRPELEKGYPLIVMAHGAGERGNCWNENCHWAARSWRFDSNSPVAPTSSNHPLLNNDHNLLHGGEVHLRARNSAGDLLPYGESLPPSSFPGFILFPQNLNAWNADPAQDLIRMVRLMCKQYNIDQNRIYIHGLSDGGTAVYEVIKRAPWLFAAAAPMSAINDTDITSLNQIDRISTLPLWIFQGGVDQSPTPSQTKGYVKAFREAGMSVRYTEYPTLGHGVWNNAYDEVDFFSWLREKNKSQIHVSAGDTSICRTDGQGVVLSLSDGFLAYQWERNGVLISGAESATYVALDTGSYRARFSRVSDPSEGDWNIWSSKVRVTEQFPAKAEIRQIGTILLRDLNDNGTAVLESASTQAHYYWYKDNVLLDLPGSRDDTLKQVVLRGGIGNGIITLSTAGYDNCPSPRSDSVYVFFNNQAPVNINAPLTFRGSASDSTVTLTWQDASVNEDNFEVWRREAYNTGSLSVWQLVAMNAANTNSFVDTTVAPSRNYHYKIRAVSKTGRSYYTPGSGGQLVVHTLDDTTPPSRPSQLRVAADGFRKYKVEWISSKDNTGVSKYVVHYFSDATSRDSLQTPNEKPESILQNLELNRIYGVFVTAIDLGGNYSEHSDTVFVNTSISGLYYEHSTGAWTDIDAINWQSAEFTGTVPNFSLSRRTQEDYFNFQFIGYVNIVNAGIYQFRISSDDGSRLTLNDTIVIDNDGLHGYLTMYGEPTFFSSGPSSINVKFFEYGGQQTLVVEYKGPDTNDSWKIIPDHALTSGQAVTMAYALSKPVETEFSGIEVYPNPIEEGGSELSINYHSPERAMARITVHSMTGEMYLTEDIAMSEGKNKVPLRIDLPKGIYILTIRSIRGTLIRKIVVR